MVELKLNSRVIALCELNEEGLEICKPGDMGVVVDGGEVPTVKFKRTGRSTIVDVDVEVLRMRTSGARLLG